MNPVTLPVPVTKTFFAENGYFLAENVFSPAEVAALEEDFNRIVTQLVESKEDVNARWGGAAMERLGANGTTFFHTHNVQNFSARWLQAF